MDKRYNNSKSGDARLNKRPQPKATLMKPETYRADRLARSTASKSLGSEAMKAKKKSTKTTLVDADHVVSAHPSAPLNDALKALEEEGVVAALRSTKEGIADLLLNTDHSLSIKLAVVYGAGLIVEADDEEWHSLCAAEEWADHPKLKPDRSDPFRAVLRMAVGFDGRKADSTVHRYYKALSPLFREKVPAIELPRLIREAGGIEKMRQRPARTVEVGGPAAVMETVSTTKETTDFKAWIRVEPIADNVTKIEIVKLKPRKAK